MPFTFFQNLATMTIIQAPSFDICILVLAAHSQDTNVPVAPSSHPHHTQHGHSSLQKDSFPDTKSNFGAASTL
jgi:hypothetical protein